MSHHRVDNTGDPKRDWVDDGPRPATPNGVNWPLGSVYPEVMFQRTHAGIDHGSFGGKEDERELVDTNP